MNYDQYVKKYDSFEEAEKDRIFYDQKKKVKTDVFKVKTHGDKFIIEQDIG